jgi:AraC family transcriptional regulator
MPASLGPLAPLARVETGGALRAMPDSLRGRTAFEREWGPVRVLQVQTEPQETPEGTLVNHLVLMNLGPEAACEARVEGCGWNAHRVPHHGVSLFPAGVPHAARAHDARELLLVEVAPAFGDEVLRPSKPGTALRPVFGSADPFATHVLLALAEEARSAAALGGVRAEALAAALVARLACPELPPQAAAGLPSARLRRVLDYVGSHLDAPLTLRKLAELAEMDFFRFVRAFKQSTGVSPHRYVLEARIAHAKELLRDRSLSITEIAFRTGFATPSHFSVTFRRMTDATPRAYRDALPPR